MHRDQIIEKAKRITQAQSTEQLKDQYRTVVERMQPLEGGSDERDALGTVAIWIAEVLEERLGVIECEAFEDEVWGVMA